MKKLNQYERWGLYWVSSDGEEDCFVVARNSRSAGRIDIDYCGFDPFDVRVYRVKPIPINIIKLWIKRRRKESPTFSLPWYADRWLLIKLGAQFRDRDSYRETLIDDMVYTNHWEGSISPRAIGVKFWKEFKEIESFNTYDHQDKYSKSQHSLLSMLGICVARCQEIEHLIAQSFVFAAMSPSEKRKNVNLTINQVVEKWKKKTLGQMVRLIEEGFDIEPIVHNCILLFLEMRNKLVHGLTTSEQYDINTAWGEAETFSFLCFFELISRTMRESFLASYYASIEIGYTKFYEGVKSPLNKKEREKAGLFGIFFSLKEMGL